MKTSKTIKNKIKNQLAPFKTRLRQIQQSPPEADRQRIEPQDLFSLFTASIIKKNVAFTRYQ
jgi:hypothetical protein